MIIYKITNLINGKIYIGKDKYNNSNYLGSGKTLKKAFIKYGKENFRKDIVEYCDSIDHMNKREVYWIEVFNSRNTEIGYNITAGGEGRSCKHSKETIQKMKISHKGCKAWNKGKVGVQKCSEEQKLKLRAAHLGKKKSKDHAKHISDGKKGKKYGPQTEERKRKTSEIIKQWWAKRKGDR